MKIFMLIVSMAVLSGCTGQDQAGAAVSPNENASSPAKSVTTSPVANVRTAAVKSTVAVEAVDSKPTLIYSISRTADTPAKTSKAPKFEVIIDTPFTQLTEANIVNEGTATVVSWDVKSGNDEFDYLITPTVVTQAGTIKPRIAYVNGYDPENINELSDLDQPTMADSSALSFQSSLVASSSSSFEFYKFRDGHSFDGETSAFATSNPFLPYFTNTIIDFAGEIFRWGNNVNASSYPAEAIADITSSRVHECYVNVSVGNVYCRGSNLWGELGLGYAGDGNGQVHGLADFDLAKPVLDANDVPLTDVIGIKSRSYVADHPLFRNATNTALKSTGEVLTWGYSLWDELGAPLAVNDFCTNNYPCASKARPVVFADLTTPVTNATQITSHCALLDTNKVVCWGLNNHVSGPKGAVGNGSNNTHFDHAEYVVDDQNNDLQNIEQIAGAGHTTCALNSTGLVYCWGNNEYGQLGIGTADTNIHNFAELASISQVESITGSGVTYTSDYSSISAFCATLTSSRVKCWGYGVHNNLGNGTNQSLATPTEVVNSDMSPFFNVVKTYTGIKSTCAVMSNFTTMCWGTGIGASSTDAPYPTQFEFF